MRLWSLHPSQLDVKGLLAAWREGLLAQMVLRGKTKGYRRHPQLLRFRELRDPVAAIGVFLSGIYREAEARGYHFDKKRIVKFNDTSRARIPVTRGQVRYEWKHLLRKLAKRDTARHRILRAQKPKVHPLFRVEPGGIADWERPESLSILTTKFTKNTKGRVS